MNLEDLLEKLNNYADALVDAEDLQCVIRTLDGDVNIADVNYDVADRRITLELGAERIP